MSEEEDWLKAVGERLDWRKSLIEQLEALGASADALNPIVREIRYVMPVNGITYALADDLLRFLRPPEKAGKGRPPRGPRPQELARRGADAMLLYGATKKQVMEAAAKRVTNIKSFQNMLNRELRYRAFWVPASPKIAYLKEKTFLRSFGLKKKVHRGHVAEWLPPKKQNSAKKA